MTLAIDRSNHVGAPQHEREKDRDRRQDDESNAALPADQQPFSRLEQKPPEEEGDENGSRKQPPGEHSPQVAPRQQRHRPDARAREEKSQVEKDESKRGDQCHPRRSIDRVERPRTIQVPDRCQRGNRQSSGRSKLGRAPAAPRFGIERQQRYAREREGDGGVRRHETNWAIRIPGNGVGEQKVINPKMQSRHALGERNEPDENNGSAHYAGRPRASISFTRSSKKPERNAAEDECHRGIRQHDDGIGRKTSQLLDIECPPEKYQ